MASRHYETGSECRPLRYNRFRIDACAARIDSGGGVCNVWNLTLILIP